MISDERLTVIAAHGRESIFPVQPDDCSAMAKELLALRKAFTEPRGYEWINGDGEVVNVLMHNPKAGDWSEQYWGERSFTAIPLYRKPE